QTRALACKLQKKSGASRGKTNVLPLPFVSYRVNPKSSRARHLSALGDVKNLCARHAKKKFLLARGVARRARTFFLHRRRSKSVGRAEHHVASAAVARELRRAHRRIGVERAHAGRAAAERDGKDAAEHRAAVG